MKYRQLGESELYVSEIGLGSLHFGAFIDQKHTKDIISKAIDYGVNFIDTAPMYGDGFSETFIGNSIKNNRGDIILSTKVGLEAITRSDGTFGTKIVRMTEKYIRASIEKSLKALKTDYIDFLQLHVYDMNTSFEKTLTVLSELIKEGKIRYVGCSNYNIQELLIAHSIMKERELPFFIGAQCHYNLMERKAGLKFIPLCKQFGMGVICNRTLARGILSGKYDNCHLIPKESRADLSVRVRAELSNTKLKIVNHLRTFSMMRGYSSVALALAWVLKNPFVSTSLVGVRNCAQLEECIKSHMIYLSSEELELIDAIISDIISLEIINSAPDLDEVKKG